MSFEVYDYRTVNRNVLVTPELRARLYHMKPGQVDGWHSHDLGHEVFLILEGEAEFNINGVKKVLGPGQMCIALADEIHQVRNMLPDKETVMYLSVTPHVYPTHTPRSTEDNTKLPYNFPPQTNYHAESDGSVPVSALVEQHAAAAQSVADAAQANAEAATGMAERLKEAIAAGDEASAAEARLAMWETIYRLHKALFAADQVWNELASRATEMR